MKAIVINGFGSSETFVERTVERPQPKRGEVLVRVLATSVNPVDYKIRNGSLAAIAPAFPAILHGDLAGVVEEVGEGVSEFKPGDEVYGCVGGVKGSAGVLADFAVVDADLIALKPRSLKAMDAAAIPLVGITAWEALVDRAKIQSGQTVLIHGGTGGVGHIAIQIAKARGAIVHATVSTDENAEIARSLGADVIINYKKSSVSDYVQQLTGGVGYDIVFDTVGGENLEKSFEAARTNGIVLTIQASGKTDLIQMLLKNLTLHFVFMLLPLLTGADRSRHGKILKEIAQIVDRGQLRPLIAEKTFIRNEIAQAHQYAESGRPRGKIVVQIAEA